MKGFQTHTQNPRTPNLKNHKPNNLSTIVENDFFFKINHSMNDLLPSNPSILHTNDIPNI